MSQKTVLITGCSSGFGKLTAKKFAAEGWNVIATMRSPEREKELKTLGNVLVAELDVCNPTQIQRAISDGLERFASIDVLVNNAGFGGFAMFEHASDESIRSMFETNVFGVMNVTRAVLPHMRRQKSGRVINVSSANGYLGAPLLSIYCSTKFAIDGFTESLAHEYRPLNIFAKTVQPGAFPTTHFGSNSKHESPREEDDLASHAQLLGERVQAAIGSLNSNDAAPNDPQIVADKIYECAISDTPIHNPVGPDAELLASTLSSMPRQDFLDRIDEMLFPSGVVPGRD